MELLLIIASIFLIGAVAGFFSSLLGIGGGFIRIPLMMLLLGLSIKTAYAVNMAVIAIATIPGVIKHYKMKHVCKKCFALAAFGAGAGILFGTEITMSVSIPTLRAIFGIACILIGLFMLYSFIKTNGKIPPRVTIDKAGSLYTGLKLVALMFLAGVVTGLCGFGGGVYYVSLFSLFEYPMHIAIGTSSAVIIPVSTIGALNMTMNGFQNWFYVLSIGIVSLFFSWLGAKATEKTKAGTLKVAFGVFIGLMGIAVAIGLI